MAQEQGINELGLFDIYQQWHVPFWHTTPFLIGVIMGVIGLMVLSLFVYRRLFKPQRTFLCWEIALKDIDKLRMYNKAKVESSKEFYYALTGILKRYMHDRYGFESREKTDKEFLHYLEQQSFTPVFMQDLIQIFEGSTTIKFANAVAVQQQIDQDLASAISFIKKTIPVNRAQ